MLNNNLSGAANVQNQGWVVSGRLFGNYALNKGWGLQFFSHFRGKQVNLQGQQGGFRMYSLAVKKDFNNKKGSVGFGAENFITPTMTIKNEIKSTTFNTGGTTTLNQYSTNVLHNLSFRVNVSYRIGKMSFDAPKRRKSVSNDDLKDGGDGNGGGGGGGMDQQQGGGQRGGATQMNGKPGTSTPAKTTGTDKKAKKKKTGN
jgi:hypothetical protein